ncbi:MAG: nucleotidyltransferase family protein, partial [Clostridiales bacterium]|nr:nucleotidyltransferase family protein [Clostridiales bacterium]
MKCIVLAAGYATRLYPLTENFPKPLLDVGGKPILNRLLEDIDNIEEITELIIVSNHKFIDHFNKWKEKQSFKNPITILDDGSVDNDHRLGAVKDIQFAAESLGIKEDVLVIAGDNILDFSFAGFVSFMKEKGASCVMCHEENDLKKQQKTGIITLDKDCLITSYEEKPIKPKGNMAVPPFYCYKAEDIKKIPEAISEGCNTDAPGSFAAWLSRKTAVHAWVMPGKRYDIGDMKSYEEARKIFK